MLELLGLVPLLLFVALALVVTFDGDSSSLRYRTDRFAMVLFGDDRRLPLVNRRVLQAAQVSTPPRLYTARTRLYATVYGILGAIVGVYVPIGIGALLQSGTAGGESGLAAVVSQPLGVRSPVGPVGTDLKVALVLLVSASLFAAYTAAAVYLYRYYTPRMAAAKRRRRIESSMTRTVAFAYALSRGGMTFPEVLRALARNEDVFGEGASEFRVAVRDIDLLGRDITTTIRKVAIRTPSDSFQAFCENLASVLQSGQDLPEFLKSQYERYRDDAAEKQDEMIEQLATAAEMYVTVAVAGVLFMITILLVIGLTTGDTLTLIQLVTYLGIPVINVVFVAYLADLLGDIGGQQILRKIRDAKRIGPIPTARFAPRALTDGGTAALDDATARMQANRSRLAVYRSLEEVRRMALRPVDALLERPIRVFYLTAPVAMVYLVYALVPPLLAGEIPDVAALDDVLVFTFVFLLGTFGLLYEASQRRLRQLEAALPDLLDRMASLNEAGMTVVQSFDRIRTSDLGAMNRELERIWLDIQWGATVTMALQRFERRVRTPSVTRLVTLVTSSMRASSDVGPVLRIAASEARAERRFQRTRRQEMSTYLIAIYISFLVFLVVIVTMDAFFIPKLVEATSGLEADAGAGVGGFMSLSSAAVASYRLTFFHAALLQAAFSGIIGGQMSDGSLKSGVKHSAIMVAVTYAVFEVAQLLL